MKAKVFNFVRGLRNGTPPRFQSYLKSLTLLLTMLLSVNVWGTDYFTDDLKATGSSTVSSRTGWTSFSNVYAHYGSAIRLGTSNKTGSITKTAMTAIGSTPTNIEVSFAAAKWNTDATGLKITVNNAGKIDGSTTYTISKDDLRGETSTSSAFTFADGDYFTVTITEATSSTTITFETTASKRVLLGDIKISSAASTYTDNFSGQKSGHFQPSFLALSQIVIWGFFAFFCKKVFHIRCTKGAYRMHIGSRPSSQPLFSPFGTLFAIAPTWLIPNWLIGYPRLVS